MLEAARKLEVVDGDVKGAIAAYQTIADKFSDQKGVASEALMRLGGAYEKFGETQQARAIYERLLRNYPDQTASASTAKVRLAALGEKPQSPSSPAQTLVWGGGPDARGVLVDDGGAPSPDGKWLTFTDWTTGDLAIRNLETGSNRRVTSQTPQSVPYATGYAAESRFSSDSKQIAYAFVGKTAIDLRVIHIDGSGGRIVYTNRETEYIKPAGWFPDGQSVLVSINTRGRAVKISRISVATGSETTLRTLPWGSLGALWLSSDGRHIAYDERIDEKSNQRRVILLASDASRAVEVSQGPGETVAGWAPDDASLLVMRNDAGQSTLFALPIASGAASGPPALLRRDVGAWRPLGVSNAGSFFYSMRLSSSEIVSGPWDSTLDRPAGEPKPVTKNLRLDHSPQWSPDSTVLVYKSGAASGGPGPRVVFVSHPTGQEREVPITDMQQIGGGGSFSPDGKSLVVVGMDQKRRRGAHLIDVQTGRATGLTFDGPGETMFNPQFLASGKGIVFFRRLNDGSRPNEVVLFDLASQEERRIPLGPGLERGCCNVMISPDGQHLMVTIGRSILPGGPILLSGPISGPFKEIARGDQIDNVLSWMPDGKHILIKTSETLPGGREASRFWRMPAEGGPRTEIVGLDSSAMQVAFSPDGRQIAYQTRTGNIDVWRIDGLVPRVRRDAQPDVRYR